MRIWYVTWALWEYIRIVSGGYTMKMAGVAAVLIIASLLSGCCAVYNHCPGPNQKMPVDADSALKEIKWQISKSEMAVKYARKAFRNYSGDRLADRKEKLKKLYTVAAQNGNVYLSTVRGFFGEPVLKNSDLMPAADAVVDSVQGLYAFAHNDGASAGKGGNTAPSAVDGERASAGLAEAGIIVYHANRELRGGYFNKMYEILNSLSWRKFSEL
jgi:osmotically-inducible protein OsmY